LLQILVCLLEAGRRCYGAFVKFDADLVARCVDGMNNFPGYFVTFIEQHIDIVKREIALESIARQDFLCWKPFS
jgi:hypothetical protein